MLPLTLDQPFVPCVQKLIASGLLETGSSQNTKMAAYGTKRVIMVLRSRMVVLLTTVSRVFDCLALKGTTT